MPDVGDDRRHDDDGDRLGRRHRHRKQAHRHRRQAEPECALHEAREQEGGGDEEKQGIEHGATLTHRRIGHNLEVPEIAFGYTEGWSGSDPQTIRALAVFKTGGSTHSDLVLSGAFNTQVWQFA